MPLIFALLLFLVDLPGRDGEPVVIVSPPQLGINATYGGSFVHLLHQRGALPLPWPAPIPLADGTAWYVDVENLGPADVDITSRDGFSVHLRPKDTVRIVSDRQRYFVKR